MRVGDLEIGKLYKIRSDRRTFVSLFKGWLDIHVNPKDSKLKYGSRYTTKKNCLLVYLGKSEGSGVRMAVYKGQTCCVYSNAWQHIVPVEE